ncbi:MAG: magnesium/cobalt transporter CorA [Moorellales bacterium]
MSRTGSGRAGALFRAARLEYNGLAMRTFSLADGKEYGSVDPAPRPVWVDLGPQELPSLAAAFSLHPAAVEDCLNGERRPRIEEYPGHLFLVANWYEAGKVRELDLFLGRDFLVSAHGPEVTLPLPPAADLQGLPGGLPALVYWILDRAVDSFFDPLDEINSELERLQDLILTRPGRAVLGSLAGLRRRLLELSRGLRAQEQVLRIALSLEALAGETGLKHYFSDVYNHAVKLAEEAEHLRELLALALETYLSYTANRTNEVMRVLAVITTIFLPLTLITGIYGMNFRFMPELEWRFGYFAVLGVMAGLALALYVYFRRRGWI